MWHWPHPANHCGGYGVLCYSEVVEWVVAGRCGQVRGGVAQTRCPFTYHGQRWSEVNWGVLRCSMLFSHLTFANVWKPSTCWYNANTFNMLVQCQCLKPSTCWYNMCRREFVPICCCTNMLSQHVVPTCCVNCMAISLVRSCTSLCISSLSLRVVPASMLCHFWWRCALIGGSGSCNMLC